MRCRGVVIAGVECFLRRFAAGVSPLPRGELLDLRAPVMEAREERSVRREGSGRSGQANRRIPNLIAERWAR